MVPSAIAPSFSHRSKSVSKEEEALFFSEAEGSTMAKIKKICPKITRHFSNSEITRHFSNSILVTYDSRNAKKTLFYLFCKWQKIVVEKDFYSFKGQTKSK